MLGKSTRRDIRGDAGVAFQCNINSTSRVKVNKAGDRAPTYQAMKVVLSDIPSASPCNPRPVPSGNPTESSSLSLSLSLSPAVECMSTAGTRISARCDFSVSKHDTQRHFWFENTHTVEYVNRASSLVYFITWDAEEWRNE